jgi:polar amino acid transport system substrate-binding protein
MLGTGILMKYLFGQACFFTLLVAFSITAGAQGDNITDSPFTVTVGVDHSPPYRIVNAQTQSGLYLDIFNEIAERLDWQVVYKEVPFRRILMLMREGEVDIMLGPVKVESRQDFMTYVAPAFPPEKRLFFYLDEENRIDRYSDLYGKAVGVLEGATYFERFDQDEKLNKQTAPRYRNLMMMLEKGRVDVVVAPEFAGLAAARNLVPQAEVSPFSVPGKSSWIAVSNKSQVMSCADELIEVLEQVEREGLMESLVQEYMGQTVN